MQLISDFLSVLQSSKHTRIMITDKLRSDDRRYDPPDMMKTSYGCIDVFTFEIYIIREITRMFSIIL